ncbi:MAG TPA: DUF721 domain-containing protein [Byssovorax sp.]|jgi:hypothetical protein
MKRRARKKLDRPEALESLLGRVSPGSVASAQAVVPPRVWAAAVGIRIAERARPISLERGVLTIRAATSVWASELSMLGAAILGRLRSAGMNVRELRFRVGPIDPPRRAATIREERDIPPPPPLEGELAKQVQKISDPELRELLDGAARASLAVARHIAPREAKKTHAAAKLGNDDDDSR